MTLDKIIKLGASEKASDLAYQTYVSNVNFLNKKKEVIHEYSYACFASLSNVDYDIKDETKYLDVYMCLPFVVKKVDKTFMLRMFREVGLYKQCKIRYVSHAELPGSKYSTEWAEVCEEDGSYIVARFDVDKVTQTNFFMAAQLLRMQQEVPYWCALMRYLKKTYPLLSSSQVMVLAFLTNITGYYNYNTGHHPITGELLALPKNLFDFSVSTTTIKQANFSNISINTYFPKLQNCYLYPNTAQWINLINRSME